MKKLIYILFLSLISLGAHAQFGYLVYHISFDSSDLYTQQSDFWGRDTVYKSYRSRLIIDTTLHHNKWQIGRPNKSVFSSAYTFPNAIVTDTLNPCSAHDTSAFIVGFRIEPDFSKFSFEYQLSIDSGDTATVEYSVDTGRSWVNVVTDTNHAFRSYFGDSIDFDTSTTGWVSVALRPDYRFLGHSDTVLFRFRLITGGSTASRDGWMIDEIKMSYPLEGVDDLRRNNHHIDLYPNPATTELTIKAADKITSIVISDVLGNVVYRQTCDKQTAVVNVADLPAGIYLVRVNDTEVRKFVKQ